MKRLAFLFLAILFFAVPSTTHAQTPCASPSGMLFSGINTTREYAAWSDGVTLYVMRCADLNVWTMPAEISYLYFDGSWSPYNLFYGLWDGTTWYMDVRTQVSLPLSTKPPTLLPPNNWQIIVTPPSILSRQSSGLWWWWRCQW